jgi:hypothetical protein
MSVEVDLSLSDYRNILNWFELAFAKSKKQHESDNITFKKLSVMCIVKMEEEKEKHED